MSGMLLQLLLSPTVWLFSFDGNVPISKTIGLHPHFSIIYFTMKKENSKLYPCHALIWIGKTESREASSVLPLLNRSGCKEKGCTMSESNLEEAVKVRKRHHDKLIADKLVIN